MFERIYAYGEERGGECISPSERECSGTHARRNVDDDDDDECHLVEYLANIPRGEFSRTCDQDAGTGARDAGHKGRPLRVLISYQFDRGPIRIFLRVPVYFNVYFVFFFFFASCFSFFSNVNDAF